MTQELAVAERAAGAIVPGSIGQMLTTQDLKAVVDRVREVYKTVMFEGTHYGLIPGTSKSTLLKPGAELLCALYGYRIGSVDISERIEQWTVRAEGESFPLFRYLIRVTLVNRAGEGVSVGVGECNSFEGKYRFRKAERVCPRCGKPTIIKGREEFGGGWVCLKKKGGCGAKFPETDEVITKQSTGLIPNTAIFDQVNTILKMAKKRAFIDATLAATGTSEFFTQDLEDITAAIPRVGQPTPEVYAGRPVDAEEAAYEPVDDEGASPNHPEASPQASKTSTAPQPTGGQATPPPSSAPSQGTQINHGNYTMPMGPNKGRKLSEIDRPTLEAAAKWCHSRQKFLDVAARIEKYLAAQPAPRAEITSYKGAKEEIVRATSHEELVEINEIVKSLVEVGAVTTDEQDELGMLCSNRDKEIKAGHPVPA